ncbi:MAG TPA: PQQ-binding-like beta-propeller repeat protein [Steroidobacteraceae bacterium]|nr:PQQ-binding-like beta-propeller repeat protein [Steroidobacteraceae bacterium]
MQPGRRAIVATLLLGGAVLFAQQRPQPPSVPSLYTAEQAAAGEKLYFEQCALCHGDDLGGREKATALAGAQFNEAWNGKNLRLLYDRLETMPPAAPKSLTAAQYSALLAFLLRHSGMPAGSVALPTDRAQLASITFGQQPAAVAAGPRTATAAVPAAGAAAAPARTAAVRRGPDTNWTTYGGNLASQRYSPADQITKDNFNQLEMVWRLKTDFLGPRPDTLYSATPLLVDRTLYTTAGTRRAAVALNAVTGEMLWMHTEDEGQRGLNAPRNGAGRGVAYWASADGRDKRVIYVTPGYRMLALDAKTGVPVPTFGKNGAVDLKLEADQEADLESAELGLNATPLVVGDVIVVGASHRPGGAPRTMRNARGMVRGYDARTGKRLWIFNTIPRRGEFGFDTWLDNSAERNGNTGVWAQMSADPELGLVYLPVEIPTGDYYGGNRPGNTLFADSLVAVDVKTGRRKWHYQTVHHDLWDYDLSCAPILFDIKVNGRTIKAIAQPTKQAFLFVFNRETGEPIWPIEERPVPQSQVPGERTSPTQPFPTRPAPFDMQGVSENDLLDLTPALKAEALEVVKRYRMGPLFTPPVFSSLDGPLATLQVPADVGGANWPGGSFDPETNHLYIHSHTAVYLSGIVPANPQQSDMGYVGGQARAGGSGGAPGPGAGPPGAPQPGRGGGPGPSRAGGPPAAGPGAPAGGPPGGAPRGGANVQGLPLVKPPYDRITAYDMNTGEMVWQKAHSSTPDDIRNHPALQGLDLPRLGQPGRTFVGTLATKTLLIAGEGGVHTNAAGRRVALLRAYDKLTGADAGAVEMPAKQTGSPMTYVIDGRQFIVLAVSGNDGAELIAYALP